MTTPAEGTPTGGSLRLLRAGSLAVVMAALATVAHVLGGGSLPGPGVLGVALLVVGAGCLAASAHRLTGRRLALLLTGSQLALHETFATLATTGADPGRLGELHGSGHHAVLTVHAMPAGAQAGHRHGTLMLLAHAAATLATAVVLTHGERALWLVSSLVAPVIREVRQVPAARPRPVVDLPVVARLCDAPLVLLAPRRGPPLPA